MRWRCLIPLVLMLLLGAGWEMAHRQPAPSAGERPAAGHESPVVAAPGRNGAAGSFQRKSAGTKATPAVELAAARVELAEMLRRDVTGLTVTEHPDGRRSLHLGGRFRHVAAVVPTADGGSRVACISNAGALDAPTQQSENESPTETITADF